MTEALRPVLQPTTKRGMALLVAGGVFLSFLFASGILHPSGLTATLLFAVAYLALAVYVVFKPFLGFAICAGTLFFLAVFAINYDRYLNAIDLLVPILLPAIVLGQVRRQCIAEDARRLVGPAHELLKKDTHGFMRAGIIYTVICFISLIPIAINIGMTEAIEITYSLGRSLEGVFMLPLGLWLLRSEKRMSRTVVAIYVAILFFAIVNLHQVFVSGTFRAGMTYVMNHPEWPVEDANEAGAGLVIVWALIIAEHQLRPRFRTYPMLFVVLFMLFLTQSRSGLLALMVFSALSLRRLKWQYLVAGAILVVAGLQVVPDDFISRITRSVTMEKGTFEVYSILVRFYGYQSCWRIFLDHPIFGVGYLSARYVSQHYNDLNITWLGAENFFLETAAGLGVIGLAAVAYIYVYLYRLGMTVGRFAQAGTRGAVLANLHFPLITALSVANLTGDNFMGVIGIGQVMLWCAMLIRSGHMAIETREAQAAATPSEPRRIDSAPNDG